LIILSVTYYTKRIANGLFTSKNNDVLLCPLKNPSVIIKLTDYYVGDTIDHELNITDGIIDETTNIVSIKDSISKSRN
jgi:hypothetical protein